MKRKLIIIFLVLATGLSAQYSPYIYRVFEYCPAPGQFINELPGYDNGDTAADMRLKAEEYIGGEEEILVSLGAYGGYIVFGFDHPVVNIPGEYDFKIYGNAFWSESNPNPEAPLRGGSSEPGIIMVSYDANNNGLPDDEWYELAGSEYYKPETIRNYEITYYKPASNHVAVPDPENKYITDRYYIRWTDNQGKEGYISRLSFHKQSYWPEWIPEETLTFKGTKLADNYIDESGNGMYYVQYAYDWGYADTAPNSEEASSMKIDWAVDKDGNPVHLPQIHFIKVYTAVNQFCGWLGETSTEIMKAEDLHPDAKTSWKQTQSDELTLLSPVVMEKLIVASSRERKALVYSLTGIRQLELSLFPGTNYADCSGLASGIYLLVSDYFSFKFIKK